MLTTFIIVCIFLVLALILSLIRQRNIHKQKQRLKQQLDQKIVLLSQSSDHKKEIQKLLTEKQKFEETNKKLWSMSEIVHKERKLVDEKNELLIVEKEKLEADKKKLDEKIKKLWSQSVSIHKEKERINELKTEIEHKHQEMLDSVNYAQRIQKALLANNNLLQSSLPDFFMLFCPKDIVSGDFYWAAQDTINTETGSKKFHLVVGDSTGHGVPGAIMSILNISCLNEAVNAQNLTQPHEILNYTRQRIIEHMANDGSAEGGKDGMDAVLCSFDFENNKLDFAAANNPLWLIRNNELIEYKPDKMPVGKAMGDMSSFTLQEIDLLKGDLIIIITDGFADQFGGDKGKKFMYKPLKEYILSINNAPMDIMQRELKTKFDEWKGKLEQVDDVTIVGVRI